MLSSQSNLISSHIYAVNYEGGKIIEHATKSTNCLAYANLQIAMDAPFNNIVASYETRLRGATETQISDYDELSLLSTLNTIFDYVMSNFNNILIVIQIARGKARVKTIDLISDILIRILKSGNRYIIYCGYKTTDYFVISDEKFVFINIGMVARLTFVHKFSAGTIFNPKLTFDLNKIDDEIKIVGMRTHLHKMNIVNNFDFVHPIILFGLDDFMPFVTPDAYAVDDFQKLINICDTYLK